jgi:hypothetical protein
VGAVGPPRQTIWFHHSSVAALTTGTARGCRNIGLSAGFKRLQGWLEISLRVTVVSCC